MQEVIRRIKADIADIRKSGDRTGALALKNLRWVGMPENPNGWRTMGDLADDLEEILPNGLGMYLVSYGADNLYMTFMAENAEHALKQFNDIGEDGEANEIFLCIKQMEIS